VRMWGFPHLTRIAIVAMLAIVAAMAFIGDQRVPLFFGIVSVGVMLAAYGIRKLLRR
jgi:GABA permease